MSFTDLTLNQARVAIDLKQTFEAYRDAVVTLARYAGGMTWKTVGDKDYLIKVINRRGGTKSLGRRSSDTERIFSEFISGKERAAERVGALKASVMEFAAMARAIGIQRVPAFVGALLRRLDQHGLLGRNLMVIGTHAMYAYESSAGVMFDAGLMATTDVDLLWDARVSLKLAMLNEDEAAEAASAGLLAILQKLDSSFVPITNVPYRATNKNGFSVDIVKQAPNPPWKKDELSRMADDDLTPAWLPNIKWLLSSEKFYSVVIGHDGIPAPMVAPDPRAFSVYKHWLSTQPDREPGKKLRDQMQAEATIELLRAKLQHLPLDENAERMFPSSVRCFSKPEFGF